MPQTVERKLGTLRRPPTIADALAASDNGKRRKRRGGPRSVGFPFASVTAQPDPSTGALVISSVSYDRLYAVQMANLFTTELLRYLRNVGVQKYHASARGLQLASHHAPGARRTSSARRSVPRSRARTRARS